MFRALKDRFASRRPGRREDALNQCEDLGRLHRLRMHARDRGERQRADARYRTLLVGGDASLSLATRQRAVQTCTDAAVLAYVARSAREEVLRRAAVERIDSERVLMEVALNDPITRMRRYAVGRMTDQSLLRSVARQARAKDQRIARDAVRRGSEIAQ